MGKTIEDVDGYGLRTRLATPDIDAGTIDTADLADCAITSPLRGGTVVTITASDDFTVTVEQLSAPIVLCDSGGAARAVTTPTGAQLSAAFPNVAEDECVFLARWTNTSDADEDQTITAGTDITLVGTAARNEGSTCSLTAILTSAADDEWTIVIEG